ncbi:MAG: decaprenyl-phosphate phosphoribosyltransferase [Clostridiales bacterium]|nr:decaprenyl-phosphate phosphoribosyltransferase [Clostridiales bacterium]
MKYIKLLRIRHWIKNILIFLPLFFSGSLLSAADKILNCILAFVCFCLVSSAIYIFNDIRDVEQDRKHPRKAKRPIASGEISVRTGIVIMVILIAAAAVISVIRIPVSGLFLVVYLLLNVSYSIWLKHIPIVDVSCIASGFLIRMMYGAFVADIAISNWLYLTVIAASFYMALGKRRNELVNTGEDTTRKVLKEYTVGFLDKAMTAMLSLTIMCYALWSVDNTTVQHYGSNNIIWTVPLVIIIILKYNLDLEKKTDGDPVEVFTHDGILISLVAVYACFMVTLLYFLR